MEIINATDGYKHPKTDDGTKNSLKGLIRVEKEDGKYVAYDQQTKDAELQGCLKNSLCRWRISKRIFSF
jgi:hypothetical protein